MREIYLPGSIPSITPELRQIAEAAGEPRLELYESVTTEFGGYADLIDFDRRTVEEPLDTDPQQTILMIHRGEPASGKSVTLYQRLSHLLRKEGVIDNLISRHGFSLQVEIIPWGDPFRTFKGGAQPNKTLRALGLQDASTDYASRVYEFALLAAISNYDPAVLAEFQKYEFNERFLGKPTLKDHLPSGTPGKSIHIIGTDIPLLRGDAVLKRLLKKKGAFAEVGDYTVSFAEFYASRIVREKAKNDRQKVEESIEKVVEKLKKGVVVHLGSNDSNTLVNYVRECATYDDVVDVEEELNRVIIELAQRGEIPGEIHYMRKGLDGKETPWTAEITDQGLKIHPDGRAKVIGTEILHRDIKDLDITGGAILYNGVLHPVVNLLLNRVFRRPVFDLFEQAA